MQVLTLRQAGTRNLLEYRSKGVAMAFTYPPGLTPSRRTLTDTRASGWEYFWIRRTQVPARVPSRSVGPNLQTAWTVPRSQASPSVRPRFRNRPSATCTAMTRSVFGGDRSSTETLRERLVGSNTTNDHSAAAPPCPRTRMPLLTSAGWPINVADDAVVGLDVLGPLVPLPIRNPAPARTTKPISTAQSGIRLPPSTTPGTARRPSRSSATARMDSSSSGGFSDTSSSWRTRVSTR